MTSLYSLAILFIDIYVYIYINILMLLVMDQPETLNTVTED